MQKSKEDCGTKMENWEKSCFLWPELQDWEDEAIIQIKRKCNPIFNKELGISWKLNDNVVSGVCYHIVDDVKVGKPARGKVNRCDWIVGFNGQSTTGMKTGGLAKLIKNAREDIQLAIRKPKHHAKNNLYWRENVVELEISSENCNSVLIEHLYLSTHNDSREDRILFYKPSRFQENGNVVQLHRGDELVSVNEKPVQRKLDFVKSLEKLPQALNRVSIKKIVPENELQEFLFCKHRLKKVRICPDAGKIGLALASHIIGNSYIHIVTNSSETGVSPGWWRPVSPGDRLMSINGTDVTDLNNFQLLELIKKQKDGLDLVLVAAEITEHTTFLGTSEEGGNSNHEDTAATACENGVENLPANGSTSSLKNGQDVESLDRENNEGDALSKNITDNGLLNGSVSSGDRDKDIAENLSKDPKEDGDKESIATKSCLQESNDACGSIEPTQSDGICDECRKQNRSRFVSEKKLWPISSISRQNFDEICARLDLDNIEKGVRVFAEFLGFSRFLADRIYQRYSSQGGVGAAKEYIETWATRSSDNNVGMLLKICEKLGRDDVIDSVKKWLNREDNCHGCGATISH